MSFSLSIFKTQQVGKYVKSIPMIFGAQIVVQSSFSLNFQSIVLGYFAFAKRLRLTKLVPLLSLLVLFSCDSVQHKLDSTADEVEYAEKNLSEMSAEDWEILEISMDELNQDLELNRDIYSEEQIKEAGKIQGKYAALVVKKGFNDLKDYVDDFGNQMEGFIEGFNLDTIN